MALDKITYPYKNTGDNFSAAEANQVKDITNLAIDQVNLQTNLIEDISNDLGEVSAEAAETSVSIANFKYRTFATYLLMSAFITAIGTTSDIWQICCLSDEQNNEGNLTNYTYTNDTLNWVATTPIAI